MPSADCRAGGRRASGFLAATSVAVIVLGAGELRRADDASAAP
ncbi:hypothetical protein PV689_25955 [Streptomyces sp. ATCC51928]|uniref:Uncharacterized protein n=1 Tax=Streptomyces caviscabies TaxID=90079 RepID=A0ABW2M6K5_9ACTN|nr:MULTISPECIES: hypothetical protein [unclassified Streptomyces]MDX3505372.1 hypothetical protein [Streptomyces sp. ATCC51928]MDX5520097.1 hypothetical protein [Streptomyces sp. DE06-01C]